MAEGPVRQVASGTDASLSGIPTERAATGGAGGEETNCLLIQHPYTVVDAAVEHHLSKDGQVGGGAEQSSMASDTTQGVGVLVVDLAAERIAARRSDFGGRATIAY